jgi:hypothetical protein
MTPDAAMHYFVDIITLCRVAPSVQIKGETSLYDLILSTMRQKSVPEIEKMR